MPRGNDIATIRIPSGRVVARVPFGTFFRETGALLLFADIDRVGNRTVATRAREIWTFAAVEDRADFVLPAAFADDGVQIDATEELKGLSGADGEYRFTVEGARDDGSDLILTMELDLGNFQTIPVLGPAIIATVVTSGYSDNHGSDTGDAVLQGRPVHIERNTASTGQPAVWQPVMPTRPGLKPVPIWVRRGAIAGDFRALALTVEGDIESVAAKTVTLTANYRPELEDLDTQIVYGTDVDGQPVVWRIASTTRTEREIELNLEASLL